jgi:hypothetical protein
LANGADKGSQTWPFTSRAGGEAVKFTITIVRDEGYHSAKPSACKYIDLREIFWLSGLFKGSYN